MSFFFNLLLREKKKRKAKKWNEITCDFEMQIT